MKHGLGRLIEFDERSRAHPIRAMIADTAKPVSKLWPCKVNLDQGPHGYCVGFGWASEAAAEPVVEPRITNKVGIEIYRRATQLDTYEDDQQEGSSVIAGAKACVEKGWYTGFKWAFSINDLLLALSHVGPVVVGINWYRGMRRPDENGLVRATGPVDGMHCTLLNENNMEEEKVRNHGTWGRWWGKRGECFITFKDLEKLLHEDGECCVPVGRRLVT